MRSLTWYGLFVDVCLTIAIILEVQCRVCRIIVVIVYAVLDELVLVRVHICSHKVVVALNRVRRVTAAHVFYLIKNN